MRQAPSSIQDKVEVSIHSITSHHITSHHITLHYIPSHHIQSHSNSTLYSNRKVSSNLDFTNDLHAKYSNLSSSCYDLRVIFM